jgi:hypothetical protein
MPRDGPPYFITRDPEQAQARASAAAPQTQKSLTRQLAEGVRDVADIARSGLEIATAGKRLYDMFDHRSYESRGTSMQEAPAMSTQTDMLVPEAFRRQVQTNPALPDVPALPTNFTFNQYRPGTPSSPDSRKPVKLKKKAYQDQLDARREDALPRPIPPAPYPPLPPAWWKRPVSVAPPMPSPVVRPDPFDFQEAGNALPTDGPMQVARALGGLSTPITLRLDTGNVAFRNVDVDLVVAWGEETGYALREKVETAMTALEHEYDVAERKAMS